MSDPIALLARLIAHRTPQPEGDERALAAILADELRARGADEVVTAEVRRPLRTAPTAWVYARFGRPTLFVNAHLDTVPAAPDWSTDPWEAKLVGDRLYGLGSADTKGAIAAILCALDEARPNGLGVLFSGDEEAGNSCAHHFLGSPHAKGLTHAIVCEPTSLRVGVRHRGVVAMTAKRKGPGGHSSRADELPAPVADLARVAVAWSDWGRERLAEGPEGYKGMCVNIAKLDGGVAHNVIPAEASLDLLVRPPPGADCFAVATALSKLARAVVPGVDVTTLLANPSFTSRDPAAFTRWVQGDRVDLPFWTEAALYAMVGIDAVVWGPGDIARAHAADEFVPVDEVLRARDAFAALFRSLR
jgi:acetylornithine deacetylase